MIIIDIIFLNRWFINDLKFVNKINKYNFLMLILNNKIVW